MQLKKVVPVIVLCFILGVSIGEGSAVAGFIDFDNITPPGPLPTLTIEGVSFTGGEVSSTLPSLTPSNVYNFPFKLTSFLPGLNFYTLFSISFDEPVFAVSFHLLNAGLRSIISFSNLVLDDFEVQSFDQGGKLLDSDKISAGLLNLGFDRLEVFSDGIMTLKVNVGVNNKGAAEIGIPFASIDNFFFERCCTDGPTVPIPSSLLLLSSGILSMVGIGIRRKSS